MKLRSLIIFIFIICAGILYCQSEMKTIKHVMQSSDNSVGKFSVISGSNQNVQSIKVKDISVSVSNDNDKKLIVSADITETAVGKTPKSIKASVKSYADTEYIREEKEKKADLPQGKTDDEGGQGNDENNIEKEEADQPDPYENVDEETLPTKMYLEIVADGSESTYDFYDKEDLQSVIDGINTQYGTNLEVTGSGRNVSVRNSAPQKKETQRTVSKRVNITKRIIEEGLTVQTAGFDILKLETELLKDKILTKSEIKSYTVILEPENIYINGNQVYDKLLSKYRKIFNNFSLEYYEE